MENALILDWENKKFEGFPSKRILLHNEKKVAGGRKISINTCFYICLNANKYVLRTNEVKCLKCLEVTEIYTNMKAALGTKPHAQVSVLAKT